jgi:hypothetical protein
VIFLSKHWKAQFRQIKKG